SVADNAGGVGLTTNSTTFTLRRTNGDYWNGAAWQATVFNLAASNSATSGNTSVTWTSSATLPSWASETDGTYTIQAKASDQAGNTFTGVAASFTFDNTAPTVASVTAPATGSAPTSFSG